MFPRLSLALSFVFFVVALRADPLTKQQEIDFGREVASRNLKGLATRSDGRILPGPVFTDLTGPKLGEILWLLKAAGPNRYLVGTGPEGKVQEITLQPGDQTYTVREVADVTETQAIALQPLPDGSLLVGTSPIAALTLFKDGKPLASVPLPADSIFDFLALPDGRVLAGTGNPARIYQLDLKKLAAAGINEGTLDETTLASKGVTLFAEIRDRNVRRLARLADGRLIAGSSPKGNLYTFDAATLPAKPIILQENRDTEVVDLLPLEQGGFYAALVTTPGDTPRIIRPTNEPTKDGKEDWKDAPKPGFTGRSSVVWFPAEGFPETVFSKGNVALYRLARWQDWLVLTAGEQGDTFGYDPVSRRSLTFAGSGSAQLNDIARLVDGRYLVLRNNAPGLALMSFTAAGPRELETKKIDLGLPSDLGLFRFSRLRGLAEGDVTLSVRTSFGSDELEGWTPWTELKPQDGGYAAPGLRGRYVRYKLSIKASATDFQLDKATLYSLPQNRRPSLGDFRIFSANLGLIPAVEQPANASATLGQLLFPSSREPKEDGADRRKTTIMNSQIVPAPGTQIIYWAVSDPDGDNLSYTFSLRPENSDTWTDLAVDSSETYLQFEIGALPEGLYLTRLTASEQAPRPVAQRLRYTFETDNLIVDRTAPVISAPQTERSERAWRFSVEAHDALSLVEGAEFVLNNGTREQTTHPADGIRDGKRETFVVEIPAAKAAGATSVEIIVYDQIGNSSSVRVPLN